MGEFSARIRVTFSVRVNSFRDYLGKKIKTTGLLPSNVAKSHSDVESRDRFDDSMLKSFEGLCEVPIVFCLKKYRLYAYILLCSGVISILEIVYHDLTCWTTMLSLKS